MPAGAQLRLGRHFYFLADGMFAAIDLKFCRATSSEHLAEDILQNPAVLVVGDFEGRVDSRGC